MGRILCMVALLMTFLLLSAIVFIATFSFRTSDARTHRYFAKRGVSLRIERVGTLRWLLVDEDAPPEAPLILFVHGAPGSADNFHRYLADSALRRRARLISLDRPGYGYSNYGDAEPSLARQAEAALTIMDRYPSAPAILIGHSYGGPVAAKVAMDYPERVRGLVMLAPVIDPDNERIFWYSHFGRWRLTRVLLSGAWRVAAAEKFSHAAELAKIADGWSKLRLPVTHLHSPKDNIAPAANIEFSRRNIPPECLRLIELPGSGHFIPWTDYNLAKQELLRLL
jgi:pimeloyl-ACP methyl ester carboxylesterase